MNTLPETTISAGELMEAVIVRGALEKLSPHERAQYYLAVCKSIGLNALTRPFEFLTLNGKLTLYARRDAADQLRKLHGINIEIASHTVHDGLLTVRARATDRSGRVDEDFGVVSVGGLRGEAAANAFLKCVTKAKRRVTLSISGLGFLDENEVEDIPEAEMSGHAFGHLAAPEHDVAPSPNAPPDAPAAQEPSAPAADQPPGSSTRGLAQPGAGAVPSSDDYLARWEVILDEALPENVNGLIEQWNAERKLRNHITWPDDGTYDRLRAAVMAKVETLKAQVTT